MTITERKVWKVDGHVIAWFLLVLLLYLDIWTTMYGTSHSLDIVEVNTLMRGIINNFWALVLVKTMYVGFVLGLTLITVEKIGKNEAMVPLSVAITVSLIVVVMNLLSLRLAGLI